MFSGVLLTWTTAPMGDTARRRGVGWWTLVMHASCMNCRLSLCRVYFGCAQQTDAWSFWATVCKSVRSMLQDCCLSCPIMSVCLSVTLVYCGQTVWRIKMKLGTQVGLGPGHIVLDGDPAPPSPKGHSPHPIFGPYLLRPNGCVDQDDTFVNIVHHIIYHWYGARPQPRRLCVRWGPSPPKFSAHVYYSYMWFR